MSTTESRPRLSRGLILETAMVLADAGGIEALSMRRLAQELGVEAMSLYHHVANKDDLVAGIVDLVLDEIELPAGDGDWKAGVRAAAISAHDALARHPWAAKLVLTSDSPARYRYMNAMLGAFREGGFSADLTDHAYHAIDSHIMGFALWVAGMNLGSDENLAALATGFMERLPREELPHLAEHVEQHLKPRDPDDPGEFVFGLDLILDGLERVRGE